MALQLPPVELPTTYAPEMESPVTTPVYVIAEEPTVPKLIVLPATTPLIWRVPGVVESMMVPVSVEPDCVHVSVNVPWKAPPYCPDHVPERSPVAGGGFVVGAAVGGATEGAVVAGGDVLGWSLFELLQPMADRATTARMAPNSGRDRRVIPKSRVIIVRSSTSG